MASQRTRVQLPPPPPFSFYTAVHGGASNEDPAFFASHFRLCPGRSAAARLSINNIRAISSPGWRHLRRSVSAAARHSSGHVPRADARGNRRHWAKQADPTRFVYSRCRLHKRDLCSIRLKPKGHSDRINRVCKSSKKTTHLPSTPVPTKQK